MKRLQRWWNGQDQVGREYAFLVIVLCIAMIVAFPLLMLGIWLFQ